MKTHRLVDANTIYQYTRNYIKEKQISPSYREIADHTYLSVGKVHYCLGILEARGHITRTPNQPRSIQIVNMDRDSIL